MQARCSLPSALAILSLPQAYQHWPHTSKASNDLLYHKDPAMLSLELGDCHPLLVTRVHSPSSNASLSQPILDGSNHWPLHRETSYYPSSICPPGYTSLLYSPCLYILTARDLFPVHSYPLNKSLHIALNQEPDRIVIILMEIGIAVENPKPSSEEETGVKTCECDFVGKNNYWEFQLHQDEKIGC